MKISERLSNRKKDNLPEGNIRFRKFESAKKDDRTVLVSNLPLDASEKEIEDYFNQRCGKVNCVKTICDSRTNKSKGIGYVEFEDIGSVIKALAMSNKKFGSNTIRIQASQAEKNRAAKAAKQQQEIFMYSGPRKIYVSGWGEHLLNLTAKDFVDLFEAFGEIEDIKLPFDKVVNKNFGYCYITYANTLAAHDAIEAMNKFDLEGFSLSVSIYDENDFIDEFSNYLNDRVMYTKNFDTDKDFKRNSDSKTDIIRLKIQSITNEELFHHPIFDIFFNAGIIIDHKIIDSNFGYFQMDSEKAVHEIYQILLQDYNYASQFDPQLVDQAEYIKY